MLAQNALINVRNVVLFYTEKNKGLSNTYLIIKEDIAPRYIQLKGILNISVGIYVLIFAMSTVTNYVCTENGKQQIYLKGKN